jgi:hypothetical protein
MDRSRLVVVTLVISLALAGAANAQVPFLSRLTFPAVSFNLTSYSDTGGKTLLSVTGSGYVSGVGCVVTSAVTGAPSFGIRGTFDGTETAFEVLPAIYVTISNFAPAWQQAVAPFHIGGLGPNVGDGVWYPMHIPFSSSASLFSENLYYSVATTGSMTCTASYVLTSE